VYQTHCESTHPQSNVSSFEKSSLYSQVVTKEGSFEQICEEHPAGEQSESFRQEPSEYFGSFWESKYTDLVVLTVFAGD
jgi:hypothetical protein